MFITFEGVDGSGKTTQVDTLANYLRKMGYDVIKTREPGGTELSEQIRNILLFSKHDINSISELFLFEAARSQLITSVVKPALEHNRKNSHNSNSNNKNKIVISDRYYDSTTAYQGYGRGLNIDDILICNSIIDKYGVKPDLTFFLDVSLETSLSRRKKNQLEVDKIEEEGIEFFGRVIEGYRQIAKNNAERVIEIFTK